MSKNILHGSLLKNVAELYFPRYFLGEVFFIEIEGANQQTPVDIESPDIGQARGNDLGSLAAAAVSWFIRAQGPGSCLVCFGSLAPYFYKVSFERKVAAWCWYPKYASIYGKFIFLSIYHKLKLMVNVGRYCTHMELIWVFYDMDNDLARVLEESQFFIEMSLEDLRCWWWWAVFLQIRWRVISKTIKVKMIIFDKTSSSRTSNTKPWGVFASKWWTGLPQDVSRLEYFGLIPPYATDDAEKNLRLSWCLFRFSLINSFLLWHCEVGVFKCT